ncbi:MAG: hypothetical protein JO276_11720, partial [Sphingomonadaceae bacterium]|nr:hypothetical protein [Sphingomonadaceae bacterium]
GCRIGGANRLTACDTNPLQLGDTTIDLDAEVIERIKASECSRALLFIDACAEDMKALAVSTRSLIFDLSDDEIERKLDCDDYLAVFLSCSDGEKSYGSDALGHGVFTWHLLRALRGEDPQALERDRWMTDSSLRDWLESEVPAYVTKEMTVRGRQRPRAILNSPHTFRIRHIPPPPAAAATTLADLGLRNSDAYLEGTETGRIRSLPGFKSGYHHVPKDVNDYAANWIGQLLEGQLQEELDDLFSAARRALGFKRKQGGVSLAGGDGNVDTPAFRYSVVCDQNPDDPADWRIRRRLELRDGWEEQREEIEDAIAGLNLDRFVVTFENRRDLYDQVADALEDLAERDGDFDERPSEKKLVYTRGAMSIIFDFQAGEVEFAVQGESNLELVETTQVISLGWANPSPMLAAAPTPALPDLRADLGEATGKTSRKPVIKRKKSRH